MKLSRTIREVICIAFLISYHKSLYKKLGSSLTSKTDRMVINMGKKKFLITKTLLLYLPQFNNSSMGGSNRNL
jgi:hypothetical protein